MRVLSLAMLLPLTGCSIISSGKAFNASDARQLKDGTTTMEEATALFGDPLLKLDQPAGQTWVYYSGAVHAIGFPLLFLYVGTMSARTENLRLDFDGNLLRQHEYSVSLGLSSSAIGPSYSGLALEPPPRPAKRKPRS